MVYINDIENIKFTSEGELITAIVDLEHYIEAISSEVDNAKQQIERLRNEYNELQKIWDNSH